MIDAIACTAQILCLFSAIFAICSGLNDSRSLVAGPLFKFACVCAGITYICERIVA